MMTSFISLIKNHFNRRGIEQSLAKVPAPVKPFLTERAIGILEKSPEGRRNVLLRSQDEAYLQLDQRAAISKKDIITKYNAAIKMAIEQITVPTLPEFKQCVNYPLAEEKAKAQLTRLSLEEEVMSLPGVSRREFWTASFLLTLSFFANLYFVTTKFGDSLAANDVVATFLNGLIALVITVAEMVGPSLMLTFLPNSLRSPVVRVLGIIGGALLVIGLIFLFMSRGELNSVVTATGAGLVE